ncbi:RICIN domain-containing protein [Actinoplanes sp. NPDC051859]|uniref:RICIN domain-containing protein n=1 Tax=Actinoplanes sp. NPDC051859 TaxID=3363909 RepID=UPI0037B30B49
MQRRFFQSIIAVVVVGAIALFTQAPAFAVGERYGPYLLATLPGGVPLCMDNPMSTSNGTTMTISTCHGGTNQQWYNEKRDRLSYWTFNRHGSKCLTVKGASHSDSAAIIQYACNDGPNERWIYEPVWAAGNTFTMTIGGRQYTSDKVFRIKNVNSSRCITVKDARHVTGNTLLQYNCDSPGINLWVQYPVG